MNFLQSDVTLLETVNQLNLHYFECQEGVNNRNYDFLWNKLEIQPHRLWSSLTIDAYVPYDVTLQVSDISLVSLLHGIVRPDAVPLL